MGHEQRATHRYWGLEQRVIWGHISEGYLGVMGEETAAREVVGHGIVAWMGSSVFSHVFVPSVGLVDLIITIMPRPDDL